MNARGNSLLCNALPDDGRPLAVVEGDAARHAADPLAGVARPAGGQARRAAVPVADPAAVLEDGAVDGAVGGEPALHALEVGVGDRRRGGAHHLWSSDGLYNASCMINL